MTRIAIADDDEGLLETLRLGFEGAGYEVSTAADGEAALALVRGGADLLVTDVNMPKLDGFTLCRRLREEGATLPILVLSSRDSEIDEALGLDLGADDYVTKPFSLRVLLARAAALLRRSAPREPEDETLERGALHLDLARLEARFHGQLLKLTVTEVRMLEAFLRSPGRVLSRDRLMQLARADDSVVAPRIVDTYVARLRRKMRAVADECPLETVVGAGYRWRE